ncbi:hypothetical protein L6164_004100 [Bauhinia variegata]|uniref:Uncharacterized protein n=1 Tax=Bauhinia variegata TaxID=167791 RepID=A0ACB9Q2V1_BAUVA|nr:hypothetical protein L6164_004100 [Bauhinia variegata]
MSILEETKGRLNIIPVRYQNFKNAVQVFGQWLAIELHHGVKGFESFIRQISFSIDFDQV